MYIITQTMKKYFVTEQQNISTKIIQNPSMILIALEKKKKKKVTLRQDS